MKAGKNYYQVLEIPVGSSPLDIKKAYRKLALVFHPDKHPDPLIAIPKFTEIKEAYDVLVDPTKRRNYDREFHLQKFQTREKPLASDADEVLQLSKELWATFKKQDPFRIDKDLLYFEITQILSEHNIRLLNFKNNSTLDQELIQYLMDASEPLALDHKEHLHIVWKKIARNNDQNLQIIEKYWRQTKILSIWDKYKMVLAIIIAISICILIFNL